MKYFVSALCLAVFCADLIPEAGNAEDQLRNWHLPLAVSDANTKATFKFDTTWITVRGKTSQLSGKVWLEDPADYRSVRAEIHFPVRAIDTANAARDNDLRKVMNEPQFPEVTLSVSGVDNLCSPEIIDQQGVCSGMMHGTLTIRGVSRALDLPFLLKKDGNAYVTGGSVKFSWKDFGVEDPSSFYARVHKTVKVDYSVRSAPQ